MKKRIVSALLSASLLITGMSLPVTAQEAEPIIQSEAIAIHKGTIGTAKWTIDSNGVLTIGEGECSETDLDEWPWSPYISSIVRIDGTAPFKMTGSLARAFYGPDVFHDENSGVVSADLSGWDTSEVTSTCEMFENSINLKSITLKNWDTASIKNMQSMFEDCSSLETLDLSEWNTGNVTDMSRMFLGCRQLTSADLSGFDTSSVTDMKLMFYECNSLESLDLQSFDTSQVRDMRSMFESCRALKCLDVGSFDTSRVTDMDRMFCDCWNLKDIDVKAFTFVNAEDVRSMFYGCLDIERLDLRSAYNSPQLDVSTIMKGCSSLQYLDISNFKANADSEEVLDIVSRNLWDIRCSQAGKPLLRDVLSGFKWFQNGKGPYEADKLPELSPNQIIRLVREDHTSEKDKEIIEKHPISSITINGLEASYSYTGGPILPNFEAVSNGEKLQEGRDYICHVFNNIDPGTAKLILTGTGDYFGTVYFDFTVDMALISEASVIGLSPSYRYTGERICPEPRVTLGSRILKKGKDYYLWYSNNINIGVAELTIRGRDGYQGEIVKEYTIDPIPIEDLEIEDFDTSYVWTGNAISPPFTVKNGDTLLRKDRDYTVSWQNNTNPGLATVTITGAGIYTGTINREFEIVKEVIQEEVVIGSEGYPFQISSLDDFEKIKDNPSSFYALTSDIDFSEVNSWESPDFAGTLDGNGFAIRNFVPENNECAGLFGKLESTAVVKNLNIENAHVSTGRQRQAGLLAAENNGTIQNCTVSGSIESVAISGDGYLYIPLGPKGGIAGRNFGRIEGVLFYGLDSKIEAYTAGGIAGYNVGEIINSIVIDAQMIASTNQNGGADMGGMAGGIAGCNMGTIRYTRSEAVVEVKREGRYSGYNFAGGITGYSAQGIIDSSVSKSTVTSDSYNNRYASYLPGKVGGIAGSCAINGTIIRYTVPIVTSVDTEIINSYSPGIDAVDETMSDGYTFTRSDDESGSLEAVISTISSNAENYSELKKILFSDVCVIKMSHGLTSFNEETLNCDPVSLQMICSSKSGSFFESPHTISVRFILPDHLSVAYNGETKSEYTFNLPGDESLSEKQYSFTVSFDSSVTPNRFYRIEALVSIDSQEEIQSFTDFYIPVKPEVPNWDDRIPVETQPISIVDLVKEYTSDQLYAQFKDISDSDMSYENKFIRMNDLFTRYGITNVSEGIEYLSSTVDKRHAYLSLTTDEVFCASLFKHDLNETAKGLYMRPVLYAAGLAFNGEIGEYIDLTHLIDHEYPGVKKYKSMLYDFMDYGAVKIEAEEYIKNLNKITKNSTKLATYDAKNLIDRMNSAKTVTELDEIIQSSEAKGVFGKLTNSNGKVVFQLDEDSGFGKFSQHVSTATDVISISDMMFSNFMDLMQMDAKLKVYEQYREFLTSVAEDRTFIPGDLAAAARQVLEEVDSGYMAQLGSFALDILNEIQTEDGSISDFIIEKCLAKTTMAGATKTLGAWLTVINVSAFFINKLGDVGEMIKKESYVEGYAFISDLYCDKLERCKQVFIQDPSEENAYAFYYYYNMLYDLRTKGEEAYLAMTKVNGILSLFSDFGYSLKKDVVKDTQNLLQTKCKFTLDNGTAVTDYARYASKAVIKCPVDVEVYNLKGNLIIRLEDGVPTDEINEYGRFVSMYNSVTEDYTKVICLNDPGNFGIRIIAKKDGLVSVDFMSDENQQLKILNNLQMTAGSTLSTSVDRLNNGSDATLERDGETENIDFRNPEGGNPQSVITDLRLDCDQLTLEQDQQYLLSVTVDPDNVRDCSVQWYSDNPDVAKVENGNITALSVGEAHIYAVASDNPDIYRSVSVQVTEASVDKHLLREATEKSWDVIEQRSLFKSSGLQKLESDLAEAERILQESNNQNEVNTIALNINHMLLQLRRKPQREASIMN